jgi:hypothetical protein
MWKVHRSFSDGTCRDWIELIETVVDLVIVIIDHTLLWVDEKCLTDSLALSD